MDYQKAFDTVPHRRLILKIKAYGFTPSIVAWLEDFLAERKQVVNIKGERSRSKQIKSGIPQGSVLGPLMFLLFVNELPELVNSFLYLFADDNKIWRRIEHPKDKETLQADLDIIYQWSKTWLMQIHPDKSAHMRIGEEMENPHFEYIVGTSAVKYSGLEKDIGVEIDTKLSFDDHINNKAKKANMMSGWIRRSFQFMNKEIFNLLYKALVRHHLEYCSSVWSPHLQKHIDKIEEVQIRATKMVPELKHKSYQERLQMLNLPTLTFRRLRGDMIEMYKIMHGIYHKDCCPRLVTMKDKTGRTGRHSLYLYQERSNIDKRKYSFTQRAVTAWNTLTEHVISAPNVNVFKNRLDKYWKDEPMKTSYREPLQKARITRK